MFDFLKLRKRDRLNFEGQTLFYRAKRFINDPFRGIPPPENTYNKNTSENLQKSDRVHFRILGQL